MTKTISERVSDAGNASVDGAKNVGTRIAQGAEKAVDYVKDTTGIGTSNVKNAAASGVVEHMDVVASCGKKIGVVDGIEGSSIKLTRKDSPDGNHHFIPLSWISQVDHRVHLNKNSVEAVEGWKSKAVACETATSI